MDLDWNLTTEQENAKKEEYLNMLMGYMQRELTDWEKEFINEDYYCKKDQIAKSVLHLSMRYEYSFGVRALFNCDIFELKIPPIGNIICL